MTDVRWTDEGGTEATIHDGRLSVYGKPSMTADDGTVAVGIDLPEPMSRIFRLSEAVSAYTFLPADDPAYPHLAVTIQRSNWGFGPYPHAKQWAIRWSGQCWTRDGKWEYEPIPSERDGEYLKHARWDLDEAAEQVEGAMAAAVASIVPFQRPPSLR